MLGACGNLPTQGANASGAVPNTIEPNRATSRGRLAAYLGAKAGRALSFLAHSDPKMSLEGSRRSAKKGRRTWPDKDPLEQVFGTRCVAAPTGVGEPDTAALARVWTEIRAPRGVPTGVLDL